MPPLSPYTFVVSRVGVFRRPESNHPPLRHPTPLPIPLSHAAVIGLPDRQRYNRITALVAGELQWMYARLHAQPRRISPMSSPDEDIDEVGLEEVDFDDQLNLWKITISFLRPRGEMDRFQAAASGYPAGTPHNASFLQDCEHRRRLRQRRFRQAPGGGRRRLTRCPPDAISTPICSCSSSWAPRIKRWYAGIVVCKHSTLKTMTCWSNCSGITSKYW